MRAINSALIVFAGALLWVLAAEFALAADLTLPRRPSETKPKIVPRQTATEPARTSSNWTGGQIGGNGGGSVANNNFVEPGAFVCADGSLLGVNCFETPFAFSGRPSSIVAGAFAGYRMQMGITVVGIEVDALWKNATTSASLSTHCAVGGPCGTGGEDRNETFTGSISQGWEASIRGRLGVLVTPSVLLYTTAGVSFGELRGSFSYSAIQFGDNTATGSESWRDIRVGGTVGAGIEAEVAAGVKLRGEYRFTHYGSYSKDVPLVNVCPGGCGSPISTNAHIDVPDVYNHKFLIGAGFDIGAI